MNDETDRPDTDSGDEIGNSDPVVRRLTELGRSEPAPIDPRFADRLESSIRTMHAEPTPARRLLLRPAVVLVAAVLAVAGIASVAVRTGDPVPIDQADQTVVARPSPTATALASPDPTATANRTPTASPTPTARPEAPTPVADATPAAPAPPVGAESTPTPGTPPSSQPAPTTAAPVRPDPAEPSPRPTTAPTPRPDPTPTAPPPLTPTPTATPTTTATPTPTAVPAPQIVLSVVDRRPRRVTLTWSIDDPAGVAEIVVAAATPGGRRLATLGPGERSLTVPRPLDGPLVVVVAARDDTGRELARSNRVAIAARR